MSDWASLKAALMRCRRNGVTLPLWWRDDDATKPTAELDQLRDLAANLNLPVHLAVVPKTAETNLAHFVTETPSFWVLVHGWQHVNHAPAKEKKSEFGYMRNDAENDIGKGHRRVKALFSNKALPVFVPPWNRINDAYLSDLVSAGFEALSTFSPRRTAQPLPHLTQINCHVDPVNWRGNRSLLPLEEVLEQTIARIDARIEGREDAYEPFGFLTHHLVHTQDVWDFSHRFLNEMLEGGAISRPLVHELKVTK